eukprot:IDg2521t1
MLSISAQTTSPRRRELVKYVACASTVHGKMGGANGPIVTERNARRAQIRAPKETPFLFSSCQHQRTPHDIEELGYQK